MKFREQYWFLSNMYPSKIAIRIHDGTYEFTCAEAAFQAMKCPSRAKDFVSLNGVDAKRLGRQVKLRADWDEIKLDVMHTVIQAKFSQSPVLTKRLKEIETEIVEDNTWNDTFWGVCRGIGKNHTGKILMAVRDSL